MQLGTRIKKIRIIKDIEVKDIAEYLDITPQGYGRIERNEVEPSEEKLQKIAAYLNVEPDFIKTFDEISWFEALHTNAAFTKFPAVSGEINYSAIDKTLADAIISLSNCIPKLMENQNYLIKTLISQMGKKDE